MTIHRCMCILSTNEQSQHLLCACFLAWSRWKLTSTSGCEERQECIDVWLCAAATQHMAAGARNTTISPKSTWRTWAHASWRPSWGHGFFLLRSAPQQLIDIVAIESADLLINLFQGPIHKIHQWDFAYSGSCFLFAHKIAPKFFSSPGLCPSNSYSSCFNQPFTSHGISPQLASISHLFFRYFQHFSLHSASCLHCIGWWIPSQCSCQTQSSCLLGAIGENLLILGSCWWDRFLVFLKLWMSSSNTILKYVGLGCCYGNPTLAEMRQYLADHPWAVADCWIIQKSNNTRAWTPTSHKWEGLGAEGVP